MSIVRYSSTADTPSITETVTQYSSDIAPVTNISSLDGTPMEVIAFIQQLDKDDEPRALDVQVAPSLQQYFRINDLQLMLQSELSIDQDQQEGTRSITGSAYVWPSVPMNVSDHFIGTIADGTVCLFQVTSVTDLTYLEKTAYGIDFNLFSVLEPEQETNLDAKTVKELWFDAATKELSSVYNRGATVAAGLGNIARIMNDTFYNKMSETFLVPDTDVSTWLYDPWLVEFWRAVVAHDSMRGLPIPKEYTVETDVKRKRSETIYDLMLNRNCYDLNVIAKQVTPVTAGAFAGPGIYNNAAYSTLTHVNWPIAKEFHSFPGIELDSDGEYYVMSKAFYERDEPNFEEFDKMVDDYLRGVEPSFEDVAKYTNGLLEKSLQEQFYQLPICYVLLRASY